MSGVELEEGRQAGIGGGGAAWGYQQHHIFCSPYLIEPTFGGPGQFKRDGKNHSFDQYNGQEIKMHK